MVFYFSGTGNSRHVARRIAALSGDTLVSINERIKTGNFQPVHADHPLVFVGPVYAGRFPRIMDDYIRKVSFSGSQKAYFVGTCAATPWATVRYVEKLCVQKSFEMQGFNAVVMPQGYVAGGGTQPMDVNEKILRDAQPKIERIAKAIAAGQPLPAEQPGKALMSTVLNPIMYAAMISAKAFAVTDKCAGCGKCADRCPLNNITMVDGKPAWGKNCTHCMACIAGCPNEAIEYGKKTQGKPRYYLDEE